MIILNINLSLTGFKLMKDIFLKFQTVIVDRKFEYQIIIKLPYILCLHKFKFTG